MTQMMAKMQQEQLKKQQQMVRDDPECKALLEKQADLQSKILSATLASDQVGVKQSTLEIAQLQQNPKYVAMMMPARVPDMRMMDESLTIHDAERPGPKRKQKLTFKIGSKSNSIGKHQQTAFHQTGSNINARRANPSTFIFSSDGQNNDCYSFKQKKTSEQGFGVTDLFGGRAAQES
eukprot:CAMPEP_0194258552 /NCGR_PEP_ID=MMETSP0158-20130606/41559_1 /TAXON_ID=33649 /ORGANISM="Thalassionema nitzschioides, Strain L26-B" /LENGTH=177 /DNA_ID=CAMNT_0038998013 /DNA_START=24 /DNA_END=554 /DNA_ORIENTATION=-